MSTMSFPRIKDALCSVLGQNNLRLEVSNLNENAFSGNLYSNGGSFCPSIFFSMERDKYVIHAYISRNVSLFSGAQERTIKNTYNKVFGAVAGDYTLECQERYIFVEQVIRYEDIIYDDEFGASNAMCIGCIVTLARYAREFYRALGGIVNNSQY